MDIVVIPCVRVSMLDVSREWTSDESVLFHLDARREERGSRDGVGGGGVGM